VKTLAQVRDELLPGCHGLRNEFPNMETDILVDFTTDSLILIAYGLSTKKRATGEITRAEIDDNQMSGVFRPRMLELIKEVSRMSSIIDDFSYIKKKMEEIKQEENATVLQPENAQTKPPIKPPCAAPVWSTGMKGSGIGYDVLEEVHYHPIRLHEQDVAGTIVGSDLVTLPDLSMHYHRSVIELPTHPDWTVRMQQYQELMEFCRKQLDSLCGVYFAKDKDHEGTAGANPGACQSDEVRRINRVGDVFGVDPILPELPS